VPEALTKREIDSLAITARILELKKLQQALSELSSKSRRKKLTADQVTARVSTFKSGGESVSMKNADLSGEWLSGLDLHDAKLNQSVLDNANLSGSNLSRADMSGVQAIEVELDHANLESVIARDSSLRASSMQGARLTRPT